MFTQRTITREDFVITAPGGTGVPHAEVATAWTAAEAAYRKAHDTPAGEPLPEHALVFRPAPNAIVISFVVETPAP